MKVYEAISTLVMCALDMGDSLDELIENLLFYATGDCDSVMSSDMSEEEQLEDAYRQLFDNDRKVFNELVESFLLDEMDIIAHNFVYDDISTKEDSNTYQAVKILVDYAVKQNLISAEDSDTMLSFYNTVNVPVLRAAFLISREYWRYVDGKYVGTKTNDFFSTGTTVTPALKDPWCDIAHYTYITHSRLNRTGCDLLIGFEPAAEPHKMSVEVKVCQQRYANAAETCISDRKVISSVIGSMDIDISFYRRNFREDAKMLAVLVNNASETAIRYIGDNERYMHPVRYGDKPVKMPLGCA